MSPRSIAREAFKTIFRNKLRSTLTLLGITIGIGAVICVVAIGKAGSEQIQNQLNNLGDNLVWVEAGGRAPNGVRTGNRATKTLVMADAIAIQQQIPLIKQVSAQIDGNVQVVYGNQNWYAGYNGVSPEYLDIKRWAITEGAFFSDYEVEHAADVCVIGDTVRQQLFPSEDPLGKVMRVKTLPCQVIGVLMPKGQSGFGDDQDNVVLMPYTTVQKKIAGISWLRDIMCSAVSFEAIRPATLQIISLLRDRHRIRSGQDNDFNIRSPEEIIQARLEANRTFTFLLIAIASVSLLVGGIGIMNVMLVSVTERTREIGIRMAVGATEGNVQVQFLVEAVILCLFGGLSGVFFGVVGSYLLGELLQWPILISTEAIVVGALFAILVGVFFGYYPALKASRLDPIEALRFE